MWWDCAAAYNGFGFVILLWFLPKSASHTKTKHYCHFLTSARSSIFENTIQCAVMWWDCAAAYNGDPADSSAEAFLPITISWKGFWCLQLIKSLIVSLPPITRIYPFYQDLGTKHWNSNAWIVCWESICSDYRVLFHDNTFVKWPTSEHLPLVGFWFGWIIHCSAANSNNCTNSQINCSTETRAPLSCCSFG